MNMPKKTSNNKVSKRSMARLMAIQTLYQHQYLEEEKEILELMNEVIDNYTIDSDKEDITSYRKKTDVIFLENLLNGILLALKDIDKDIEKSLDKNRSFDQIPDVMVQILRLGIFELKFMKDNPVKVVINEYVDIASSFYDQNKVKFVNAILDKNHG